MKVILFGATGMIGQGALRECLLDGEVENVLAVGRSATGQRHDKLRELLHQDLLDLSAIEGELTGYDACLFCLGVSSAGMKEADYRRVTYDFTLSVARTLLRRNPGMTFIYISGQGTDSTEKGRSMWARVKGETENALLKMPWKGVYMFRPGAIIPLHGITSRTRLYRVAIAVMRPVFPLLKALFPQHITTTERLGRALIAVARHGFPRQVLTPRDINEAGEAGARDSNRVGEAPSRQ